MLKKIIFKITLNSVKIYTTLGFGRGTGRNHMFPYFWNVAETCNSMFPLCLRKSDPVPLYTQQRKREKTSRNR